MSTFYIVHSISVISLLMLIVNSFLFVKTSKKKNKVYKILMLYLVVLSFIELFCNSMVILNFGNNFFISHFYFNFQFLFLSFLFYNLFENRILKHIVIINLLGSWFFLALQYSLDPSLFWRFNLTEILFISFLLIVYSLINLYNNLGKEKKSYFYFSIGLIMYLLCSSVIFMSGNLELVFLKKPYIDIWIFNSLFYIVYQVFIFKEWKTLIKYS